VAGAQRSAVVPLLPVVPQPKRPHQQQKRRRRRRRKSPTTTWYVLLSLRIKSLLSVLQGFGLFD
jgi:hypothetical protein